ncbi:COP23 domain-containing protein [Lusitaniella coriacea]|uniref:COP23 domain-containing protein n=1 Tax=Lusitaniella coriacea TaxID=1983105 RepID=UPI003CE8BC87
MSNNKGFNIANLAIGIISVSIGVATLALAVKAGWIPVMFGKNDRFSCELRPDTAKGGEVWTVMYRNEKRKQPWLKMVTTLGGNWTPSERCQEIARKLELYREDGLIKLTYRTDPATPSQDVICAYTKESGDECPLLITLKPGTNSYETLREMTAALAGGDGVYQSSNGASTDTLSPTSPEVNLGSLLAEEDRK